MTIQKRLGVTTQTSLSHQHQAKDDLDHDEMPWRVVCVGSRFAAGIAAEGHCATLGPTSTFLKNQSGCDLITKVHPGPPRCFGPETSRCDSAADAPGAPLARAGLASCRLRQKVPEIANVPMSISLSF